MRFLSLFSGIEAASAAWHPLGWECVAVAEVEPFPCAVLPHHYPAVPNLGDINKITRQQIEALGHIDVIVLGFPCQDVSIAGQRKGFENADGTLTRSGLFFIAMRIIEWSKARWTIGENVPGLFSANEGRDFASVVGELAGIEIDVPRDGWRTAGVALGKRGLVEWFVLDAQYTRVATHPRAVPQRRRRVFIVRDTGDWKSRPPLFLEPEGMRRNPPPRREARQRPAPTLAARTRGGGGLGTDFDLDGGQTTVQCGEIVPQAMSSKWSKGSSGPAGDEVANLVAHSLNGFADYNGDTPTLRAEGGDAGGGSEALVTHSLTGEGFDASEDGTGRGTPVVAVNDITAFRSEMGGNDGGVYADGTTPTCTSAPPAIAFSCKDNGRDATAELSPTLRGMGHSESHANGGGQIAVAFRAAGQDGFTPSDVAPPIAAPDGGGAGAPTIAFSGRMRGAEPKVGREERPPLAMIEKTGAIDTVKPWNITTGTAVRRLTPLECERLMGLPDNYTRIPAKITTKFGLPPDPENPNHWAKDGPRYKALGNSFAVNCLVWIGQRIDELQKISA